MERDFLNRQMFILKSSIDDFRRGRTSLNTLVARIEGLANVLDDAVFQDAASEVAWSLEQINAALLEGAPMTSTHEDIIRVDLEKLDALVVRYASPADEGEL
jgi:hypothetical protein